MPGGDRTGPMGMGSMTGRGMGVCSGRAGSAMYLGGGRFAWGCGMGFGGRGRRNRFWARQSGAALAPQPEPLSASDELAELKQQAQALQDSLKDINRRIEQLSKASL